MFEHSNRTSGSHIYKFEIFSQNLQENAKKIVSQMQFDGSRHVLYYFPRSRNSILEVVLSFAEPIFER